MALFPGIRSYFTGVIKKRIFVLRNQDGGLGNIDTFHHNINVTGVRVGERSDILNPAESCGAEGWKTRTRIHTYSPCKS